MSIDRRRFLQGGVLLGFNGIINNPLNALFEAIARDVLAKAHAEAIGSGGSRNYLNIGLFGAPARFTFDHWLRTNNSDPGLIGNPMTGTKLAASGGRIVGLQSGTVAHGDMLVPHLFSTSVTTSAGQVGLSELLKHMLVIRGYTSSIDGHPLNFNYNQRPIGGLPSLSGVAADASTRLFEAVQWPNRGGFGVYASGNSVSLTKLFSEDPLSELLGTFNSTNGTKALRKNVDAEISEFKDRLKAATSTETKTATIARKSLDNALVLMRDGVGDFPAFWNSAVTRYRSIVYGAMRTNGLPGLSDIPVTSMGEVAYRMFTNRKTGIVNANYDLRQSLSSLYAGSIAEGLAMAEYCYLNNLTTSLEISMDNPTFNVPLDGEGSPQPTAVQKDMHETGSVVTGFLTAMYFRGLGAGLLELISKLKGGTTKEGKNVWEQTVIQIISEFGRVPRTDGSGSDHGYQSMITSAFSGSFDNGPEIVGNIRQSGIADNYAGTQGVAAPIEGYNQSGQPTPAMMASTVSALLGIDHNPWENSALPLVRLEGGKLKTRFGRGKIVGG